MHGTWCLLQGWLKLWLHVSCCSPWRCTFGLRGCLLVRCGRRSRSAARRLRCPANRRLCSSTRRQMDGGSLLDFVIITVVVPAKGILNGHPRRRWYHRSLPFDPFPIRWTTTRHNNVLVTYCCSTRYNNRTQCFPHRVVFWSGVELDSLLRVVVTKGRGVSTQSNCFALPRSSFHLRTHKILEVGMLATDLRRAQVLQPAIKAAAYAKRQLCVDIMVAPCSHGSCKEAVEPYKMYRRNNPCDLAPRISYGTISLTSGQAYC